MILCSGFYCIDNSFSLQDTPLHSEGFFSGTEIILYFIGIKNGVSVHASHDQLGSQIYLSDRIRQFYDQKRLEITGKQPLISPLFMKGRIENPKYKPLKRTIPEDEIVNDNVKKAKSQGKIGESV